MSFIGNPRDPGGGFDYAFILADGDGRILQWNEDTDANFVDFDYSVLSLGIYYIFGLSYDQANVMDDVGDFIAMVLTGPQTDDIA